MGEELIAQYGPIGGILAMLALLLWREVGTAKDAPKTDRAAEELLRGMHEQFIANMVLFRETNQRLQNIETLLGGLMNVQRDILTETARGKR